MPMSARWRLERITDPREQGHSATHRSTNARYGAVLAVKAIRADLQYGKGTKKEGGTP